MTDLFQSKNKFAKHEVWILLKRGRKHPGSLSGGNRRLGLLIRRLLACEIAYDVK